MSEIDRRFAADYLEDLSGLLGKLDPGPVAEAIRLLREAGRAGRTIYSCGNGGSAAIASQMVVDMVKGASTASGVHYRMISLVDSVETLTATANDIDYESIFVEPLRHFAQENDVLIAVSGSGNSANVLRAVEFANDAGLRTIGLTTSTGGRLKDLAQLPLVVPSKHMGRLEDCFFVLTHIMCYACMEEGG